MSKNNMPKNSPITTYIKSTSKEAQPKLKEMLEILRSAVPNADEVLKWRLPAFSQGTILFMFGAFKKHIGFYPTPAVLTAFKKELATYEMGKGSVQFPLDKPLPKILIKKMARYRYKDATKNGVRWM